MKIEVITGFPGLVEGPVRESILWQAQKKTDVEIIVTNLRDFTHDKHRIIDDYPYGGGYGMVLKPEPFSEAIDEAFNHFNEKPVVIYPSPQGVVFNQDLAHELSEKQNLLFLCGHYKGIDQRVLDTYVDMEVSIGDYIISGGELAALVMIDALIRLQPGVLNHIESAESDSFSDYLLDSPYFTRPESFRGKEVPEVLLSGHHEKIRKWRLDKKIEKTQRIRPDLYEKYLEEKKANGGD